MNNELKNKANSNPTCSELVEPIYRGVASGEAGIYRGVASGEAGIYRGVASGEVGIYRGIASGEAGTKPIFRHKGLTATYKLVR
jgi:hypothetical protein